MCACGCACACDTFGMHFFLSMRLITTAEWVTFFSLRYEDERNRSYGKFSVNATVCVLRCCMFQKAEIVCVCYVKQMDEPHKKRATNRMFTARYKSFECKWMMHVFSCVQCVVAQGQWTLALFIWNSLEYLIWYKFCVCFFLFGVRPHFSLSCTSRIDECRKLWTKTRTKQYYPNVEFEVCKIECNWNRWLDSKVTNKLYITFFDSNVLIQ